MTDSETQALLDKLTGYATGAVKYGNVDLDWVNKRLALIGANPVTVNATYKINTPIIGSYGTTVVASSRTDALAKFQEYAEQVFARRELRTDSHGQGVFNIEPNPAYGGPQIYSGPQDYEKQDYSLTVEEARQAVRKFILDAVTQTNWSYQYAEEQFEKLGLGPIPKLSSKVVEVPVSGTAQMMVPVFEDSTDDDVQQTVHARLNTEKIVVKAEEVGDVRFARPNLTETVGMTIVDDDEDDVF